MQVKIIDTFFDDLTVGKVYDAVESKNELWIDSDWGIAVNLHTEANQELIEYEILK
ncbi:hypothetical protein iPHageKPN11i_00146 [Klebsiella phage iPHaGe-KPN-11i]|nr:hypothetical protein iPHageKPN12i_00155 [Klebsiella phage iPHaGe-KPN-12i]WOL25488.1 hypothetical protein iPHageKPN11i_00146 [Klebsiella phage iPHaGe-KPN-11i]